MLHMLEVAQLPVRPEGVDRRLERTGQLLQRNTNVVRGIQSRANNYVVHVLNKIRW